jgi:hypothetical protein
MTPGSGRRRRQARRCGAHRKTRQRRPVLTRTIAAGAAIVSLGAAYEATAPTVHALAIVFRNPDGNGGTNEVRINILQGNIFDPQLAILGNNVSDNSSTAGGAVSTGKNLLVDNPFVNNPLTQLINRWWNQEIVFGPAASGPINNTTQISVGSFNIFNPQASIFGGNLSNNTTIGNVATGNGNQAAATAKSPAGLWGWLGGMTGNGNTEQLALFSDNIFNPQWSLLGSNTSSNTAITNVADNNGNNSQTQATSGGLLGAVVHAWGSLLLGGMTGNGNTNQTAVGTSNVYNPQGSIGGQNQSSNTAATNEAVGNGNQSTTTVSPAGGSGNTIVVGTTGNGNTTQTASGASNIENPQVSIGSVHKTTAAATKTASTGPSTNNPSTNNPSTNNVAASTSVTSTQSVGSAGGTVGQTGNAQTASHPTGSAGSSSSGGPAK